MKQRGYSAASGRISAGCSTSSSRNSSRSRTPPRSGATIARRAAGSSASRCRAQATTAAHSASRSAQGSTDFRLPAWHAGGTCSTATPRPLSAAIRSFSSGVKRSKPANTTVSGKAKCPAASRAISCRWTPATSSQPAARQRLSKSDCQPTNRPASSDSGAPSGFSFQTRHRACASAAEAAMPCRSNSGAASLSEPAITFSHNSRSAKGSSASGRSAMPLSCASSARLASHWPRVSA